MKAIIAIVTIIVLGGCAGHDSLEMSLGYNVWSDEDWKGGPDNATISLRRDFDDRNFCRVTHVSHLLAGGPLYPNRDETWYNEIACGVKFSLE